MVGAPKPRRRGDQQHTDEHEEGDAGGQAHQRRDRTDHLGQHGRHHADQDATEVRERETAEPAQGGRAEGLHHQQGQQRGVQAQRRGDQDPGQGGEGRTDHPGQCPHADGTGAGEVEEIGIVDHRPHRCTEPGLPHEQRQTERGQRGHGGAEDLLVLDQHALDRDPALRHEVGELAGLEPVLQVEQALHHEEEADGGHDLEDGPGVDFRRIERSRRQC